MRTKDEEDYGNAFFSKTQQKVRNLGITSEERRTRNRRLAATRHPAITTDATKDMAAMTISARDLTPFKFLMHRYLTHLRVGIIFNISLLNNHYSYS